MKSHITYLMFNGKSMLRLALLLCGITFLSLQEAQATHIVGGDLTYRCLGNNMYEIRLTMRRDCFLGDPGAQFDNPASIAFYDAVTGELAPGGPFGGELRIAYNADDTLNQFNISDCSVISGPVCVHQTTYVDTLFLPYLANGYVMAYQRCCRNSSLTNVLNPLGTGMTLIAELSGPAQLQCNDSPQFGDYPPIYICVNKEINFDHSATDVEGDSLVYSLCAPYSGGDQTNNKPQPAPPPPYNQINFHPAYGLDNLLGGIPLEIDPQTGVLTGTPNTIGQFVIGICVTAYTNGVITGTTRRDFQYNVRMCRDVPIAEFSAPSLDCEDLTVVFDNQSQLADNYLWIYDYGNPNSPSSTLFEPVHTFAEEGFYDVALIASDSLGFCYDTIVHRIGVFDSQVDAGFTFDVPDCSDEIVLSFTDTSDDPSIYDIVSWEWLVTTPMGVLPSTIQNPTFTFPVNGVSTIFAVLKVTSSNGCMATQDTSFPVQLISLLINPQSDSICFGDTIPLILGGDSNLTYIINPTLGLDTTIPWDPLAFPGVNVEYCITVTDGLCEVTDCTPVAVQQLPNLAFDYDTDCKSLVVAFNNNSTGGEEFLWNFGDPNNSTSEEDNPVFTFPEAGIYSVTLSSRDGCDVSVSQEVTSNAILETLEDSAVNCFNPSISLNPVIEGDYIYVWSDPNLTGPNPTVTITDDTEYFVTISSPGLPGCEIVDSITILIPDEFAVSAGGDVTTCLVGEVELVATVTGNDNVDYEWTDTGGNPLSDEATLTVTPTLTDTFIVTVTDTLGCSKSDEVVVNRPDPGFDVDAGPDTTYCNIQSILLTGTSTPTSGIGFTWFNEDGVLIGDVSEVIATPGDPACFSLIGTDALGCEASDTVCLEPTFFDLDISQDQSICLGESIEICVVDNLGQDLDYLWSPVESIVSGAVTDCALVNPSDTTTYTVLVTNNDLGCTTEDSVVVVVNLFDPLIVVVDADPDTITITEPVQLTVNQPANFGFTWTSSTGEAVDPIFNPVVFPTGSPTTYTVTVTNEAGCTAVASVSIGVADPACDESDIFLPNAFTPNGDGHNDMLFVRSNFVSSMELHIYNRWGEEVFSTTSQSVGWDGKYKGKDLPPDVFGYYMSVSCPNEKSFSKKGNITLLK